MFGLATVLIDDPGFHVGKEQTADHLYVRFHGQNYDIWHRTRMKMTIGGIVRLIFAQSLPRAGG